jgi:hypothetical protein
MTALLDPRRLVWFGVGGGAIAWTLQHVAGILLRLAACNAINQNDALPAHVWTVVATASAATVAVAAEATALVLYLRFREQDGEPPPSRVRFLSIVGLAVNPLFLAIILMSGLGSVLMQTCHQS